MPSVIAYHRPASVDEAVSLLSAANTEALAGGTVVVPKARQRKDVGVELVDLQALGLSGIEEVDGQLRIGAMTRLDELAGDERVPDLVREMATRELPSALRNQATVGGTVALMSRDSVLLASLMAHGMDVERTGPTLITSVSIAADGVGAHASTARTPADVPIVAAIGRRAEGGDTIIVTGIADTPVPAGTAVSFADFRGSVEYRSHVADVLVARVSAELGQSRDG